MKKDKIDIFDILMKDNNVNNYTKMLILLNRLNYYSDNYIPNIKLMKMLGINKKNTIRIINKLKEEKIIYVYYIGKKRYFKFINKKINEDKMEYTSLYDYNWLEEEQRCQMTKELLILGIIISSFINYLIVKFEIKQNIDLFYALHFEEVERQIKKNSMQKNEKEN